MMKYQLSPVYCKTGISRKVAMPSLRRVIGPEY